MSFYGCVLKQAYHFFIQQDHVADFLGGVLSQSDLLNSDSSEMLDEAELKKKKQRKVHGGFTSVMHLAHHFCCLHCSSLCEWTLGSGFNQIDLTEVIDLTVYFKKLADACTI
jgi:hypothetical protein